MNKSLLEYFESSDDFPYLIKIEDIDINIYPYRELWKQSKSELCTDYLKVITIQPQEWFEEVIPIIAKFDYIQLVSNCCIINYSDDLKMTSFQYEVRNFSSLIEIEEYLENVKNNFKRTAIRSITKNIIIADDLKTNQISWQIKSSEFNFNVEIQRDKKISQILN